MMDGWMTGWLPGWYSHPVVQPHNATVEAERMGGLRSPLDGELAGSGNRWAVGS